MTNDNKTQIVKDVKNRSLAVIREFHAPVKDVWHAFTDKEVLDQWWAPRPWKASTKFMNFSPGGHWLYAMVGPDGSKHWGRMNYIAIDYLKSYDIEDSFCDENGNVNADLPVSKGKNVFTKTAGGTRVEFKTIYPTEADLQKVLEMGMAEGITICFEQLEKLFVGKEA